MVNGTKVRKNTECVVIVRTKNIMIIHAKYKTMILKEISDSLIHTAPRSVSLVYHNFRNDGEVIPQSRTNRRRNEPRKFAYAESPIGENCRLNLF